MERHAPEQLDHLSVGLPPATAVWQAQMGISDPIPHPAFGEARNDFERVIPFPGAEAVTHSAFVAARTLEFLDQQAGAGNPFFCIAGFYSPHAPLVVPQRFLDLYDRHTLSLPNFDAETDHKRREMGWTDEYLREVRHGYYGMISEVDHHIGRIIKQLKESGRYENTIILYTADHGEWLGDHLKFGKGYPADDAVSRVPLIIHLPEALAPGLDQQAILEAVDVLPTLLEAAAIQVPPTLQGRSFFPLLVGRAGYSARESALTEHHGWQTLRTDRYRYLIEAGGREGLWDLSDPTGAYRDIAAEPEMAPVLSAHRHRLLQRHLQQERPLPRTWPY